LLVRGVVDPVARAKADAIGKQSNRAFLVDAKILVSLEDRRSCVLDVDVRKEPPAEGELLDAVGLRSREPRATTRRERFAGPS
jgi:hypothetical protein